MIRVSRGGACNIASNKADEKIARVLVPVLQLESRTFGRLFWTVARQECCRK